MHNLKPLSFDDVYAHTNLVRALMASGIGGRALDAAFVTFLRGGLKKAMSELFYHYSMHAEHFHDGCVDNPLILNRAWASGVGCSMDLREN